MSSVVDFNGEVLDAERLGLDANGRFDPHVLSHQVRRVGEQRADARAAAEMLEQTKASILSRMTNEIRSTEPDLTRKEAEDLARGSDGFLAHIRGSVDARQVADRHEAIWKACLVLSDGLRTVEATKRAERGAYTR